MFDPNQSNTTKTGNISTTLRGDGKGNLTFGNCFDSGTVKLYVGGKLEDTVEANTGNRTVQFDYSDGDNLELSVEGGGVLKMSNFVILQCSCKISIFYCLYLISILQMK